MASAGGWMGSSASSSRGGGGWTQRQNKQFERALAVYDRETPDRWHNVARYMGGAKSPDEVRRHFEQLVADVAQIESGRVPFPRYAAATSSSAPASATGAGGLDDGIRHRYIKFQ